MAAKKKRTGAPVELSAEVRRRLEDGEAPDDLMAELVERGHKPGNVERLVRRVDGEVQDAARIDASDRTKKKATSPAVFIGLAIAAFGVIVTIVSHSNANATGGYTIWYGAIVGGIVVAIRGMMR